MVAAKAVAKNIILMLSEIQKIDLSAENKLYTGPGPVMCVIWTCGWSLSVCLINFMKSRLKWDSETFVFNIKSLLSHFFAELLSYKEIVPTGTLNPSH